MWNFFKSGIILMFVASLTSCGNSALSGNTETSESTTIKRTLPLPVIPESFVSTEERAGYLLRHFWDGLDFGSDTLLVRDRDFMEQNFVNYVSVFDISDKGTVLGTVKRLLYEAHKDSAAYMLLVDIAEKYLYNQDSPMLNEDAYEAFLYAERSETGDYNTRERKSKIDYQLSSISKNRLGHEATDFLYADANGNISSLDKTQAPGYLLLVFFDPTCGNCRTCVDMLETDTKVKRLLTKHRMTVLAVDIDGGRAAWEQVKRNYPSTWLVVRDCSNLRNREQYVMRNMPSMYLLDNNKIVVLKDVTVENLIAFLCDGAGTSIEPLGQELAHL